ncbi:MAG: replication initiator protein A [Lachnospiraceae bacterium]|nr:replication initiator protein A [Lachnospiraceae bacterium]
MASNTIKTTFANPDNTWWADLSFRFYRIPKALLENAHYKSLSPEAALLYGILFDRISLSAKNPQYRNKNGEVYVICTNKDICQKLNCGHEKASRLLSELEKHHLIRIDRTYKKGRANRIHVLPFIMSDFPTPSEDTSDNQNPSAPESRHNDVRKSDTNDTDNSDTDDIETIHLGDCWSKELICQEVKKWIGYEALAKEERYLSLLDLAVCVMTDALASESDHLSIGKANYTYRRVSSRLLQIDRLHMQYVLESILASGTAIRNPNAFMLSQLFYAPVNIKSMRDIELVDWIRKEIHAEGVMS